jgi:predicted RNA-binding Zn-ribbon protein involved in translation (DUF1610 family)
VPIKVTCSSCGVTLSTPDSSAGKRAKCPQCAAAIDIPSFDQDDFELEPLAAEPLVAEPLVAAPPAAEDRRPCPVCGEMIMREAIKCRFCGEVFDKSLKGALRNSPQGIDAVAWSKVRSGLSILYNCVGIMFGTIILAGVCGGIMGFTAGPDSPPEPPAAFMIAFAIGGLVILIAGIGMLVGQVRCTNVPPESGAHGMAVGSVVCTTGYIFMSMLGGALNTEGLTVVAGLLSMVGWFLFILFIRRSAQYLGDDELASNVAKFLWFAVILIASGFVMIVLAATNGSDVLIGVVALFFVIGGLINFLWFIRLIRAIRITIDHELEGPTTGFFS